MQGVGGVGRGAVNLGDTEQCESDKQGFLNPSGDISPRLVRGFLFAVTFREHWAIARKSEQFYSVAALYVLFDYSNQVAVLIFYIPLL